MHLQLLAHLFRLHSFVSLPPNQKSFTWHLKLCLCWAKTQKKEKPNCKRQTYFSKAYKILAAITFKGVDCFGFFFMWTRKRDARSYTILPTHRCAIRDWKGWRRFGDHHEEEGTTATTHLLVLQPTTRSSGNPKGFFSHQPLCLLRRSQQIVVSTEHPLTAATHIHLPELLLELTGMSL